MTPRILIATPVDGNPATATVSHGYHQKVRELIQSGAITVPSNLTFADDLARARSRCVWYALQIPEWEWVLWWDDDVVPHDITIVNRMIECAEWHGVNVIGAPYPRKRIPAQFPYRPLDKDIASGSMPFENGAVPVEWLAFGFMLTSRHCLECMVEHYKEEWFTDGHDSNNPHETVALFRQVMTKTEMVTMPDGTRRRHRELLSEDYSFCHRWRQMNGTILMYVGEGSPLAHVGRHSFTGTFADLGRIS